MENAGRLMDSLRKNPAIASVTTQFDAGVPQRRLRIDKQQALAAGVDLGTLYGELTTLLGGAYINNFTRFGKLYQTYIQAAPDYRLDRRSLDSYYVTSASGESVPVASLIDVADTVGVEYVSQFNLYRSVSLTVTPAARASTTTVMREITATAAETLPTTSARRGAEPPIRRPTPRRPAGWSTRWPSCSCSSRWRPSTNRGGCRWRS